MKRIEVTWEYHEIHGANGSEIIEVDDDLTDEEIRKMAEDIAFDHFSYGWQEVE